VELGRKRKRKKEKKTNQPKKKSDKALEILEDERVRPTKRAENSEAEPFLILNGLGWWLSSAGRILFRACVWWGGISMSDFLL
jgi:hypothetical protein